MKYKAYEEYKDSGVEWCIKLPINWNNIKLRWTSSIFAGGTPSKTNHHYWNKGNVPWINSGAVNQQLITIPSAFITEDALENSSAKWIPRGSLVMALAGQGKTKGIVAQVDIATTCNQSMAAIVVNKNLPSRYLFWWLSSNYQNVRNMAGGDLRDGLNLEHLGNIQCPQPSITECFSIANFLDHETAKIDTLIEKQQQLIELLKEKRQAVISHAVTKGLNPDVPMKDSGVEWLEPIPISWQISRLGFECSVKARLGWKGLKAEEYVPVGYVFLATPNIKSNEIDFRNVNRITKKRFEESPEIILKKGDILVTKDGSTTGTTNIVHTLPEPATVNSSIAVLRSYGKMKSTYLYYFFTSPYTQNVINRMKDGMGVPHLFQADLRKFSILIPPTIEQERIGNHLKIKTTQIDTLIAKIEEAISLLKERRTALISAAVTGKIDVRDWQPNQAPQQSRQVQQ